MKPVIQQETTGCAIASSAAIAAISYEEAQKQANRLGIFAEDPLLWSDTSYIRRLLDSFGILTGNEQIPFAGWEALTDCALLSIKWHLELGKPYWHWVVFIREGNRQYVLDSRKGLKSNVRTDFGRMKPKWYIEVRL